MSEKLSRSRVGNFTSSMIFKLMGAPAPMKTYIEEKKLERQLGRNLNLEVTTGPMNWGALCEYRVNDLLGIEWKSCGMKTLDHAEIVAWRGSPDFRNDIHKKGAELKCYEPKHFAECVNAFRTSDLDLIKKECAKEYWQGISNMVLLDAEAFQWLFYMPYEKELPEILAMERRFDDDEQFQFRYIFNAIRDGKIETLAYLPNDCKHFKNLNVFEFSREQLLNDCKALAAAVIRASKLLEA